MIMITIGCIWRQQWLNEARLRARWLCKEEDSILNDGATITKHEIISVRSLR